MNREEALKICSVMSSQASDGDYANHSLANTLKSQFPEFDWRVILDRSGYRTRWTLTIDDNDPRELMPLACSNTGGKLICDGSWHPTEEEKRGCYHGARWYCSEDCRSEDQKRFSDEHEARMAETFDKVSAPEDKHSPYARAYDDTQRVPLSGEPALTPDAGAPQPIDPATGQHKDYWVLSEEERKKNFVRPVRLTYRHVGTRPRFPTRDLTAEEKERYADCNYVLYEIYPESESPCLGSFWTKERLESGCGTTTSMGRAIAETYARSIHFYGKTFCCHCRDHFLVGERGEFVWEGTSERVGT